MKNSRNAWLVPVVVLVLVLTIQTIGWGANQTADEKKPSSSFDISREVGRSMSRHAIQVRQQLEKKARSLFHREPLGFDWQTVEHLLNQITVLPLEVPQLTRSLIEQSRLLGVVGSMLVLVFLIALIYSFLGQKRVMRRIENRLGGMHFRISENVYPYLLAAIRVVIAALVPLTLLAAYTLISALIAYQAGWFRLIGRLLLLWAAGSLLIKLLRELLTRELFGISAEQGRSLFRPARLIVLYAVVAIGLYWAAVAFQLRGDILALLAFLISLSIIVICFLLLLKKNSLLAMLPDLPHAGYQRFLRLFSRNYFPLIVLSLLLALLWVLGYRSLGEVVLVKIWASVAAYLGIMIVYHGLIGVLKRWYEHTDKTDEAAALVFRSMKGLLLYATVMAAILVVLNLLGLLGVLKEIMSFTIFARGTTNVTLWIILEAALILLAFVYCSRLLQAYLDYRVYPAVGVEPGLGYAINTFLKYLMLAVGFLIALDVVGLDLRFLFVFAGAVGIGIGMGLQNMAANVISGFTLIFGGKLRKGDWIQVSGHMGVVTDILLRATNVRTRDNIEYLIPNTELVNGTLVNYSLGSPLIRIDVPIGVSYNADPKRVREILLEAAAREHLVSKEKRPVVRFIEFGDSSLNFQLLVWINVRTTPRRKIRSALYFAIFEALAREGIEIPFPQRDIHIRSTVAADVP